MEKYTIVRKITNTLLGRAGQDYVNYLIEYKGKEYDVAWSKVPGGLADLSDEPFWNPLAPVGDEYSDLCEAFRREGYRAGTIITPASFEKFGGKATPEQIKDMILRSDWVGFDPYFLGGLDIPTLLESTKEFVQTCYDLNRPVVLIMQAFAAPGTEEAVQAYNVELAKLPFEQIVVCDAFDFWDIDDSWQIEPYPPGYEHPVPEKTKTNWWVIGGIALAMLGLGLILL